MLEVLPLLDPPTRSCSEGAAFASVRSACSGDPSAPKLRRLFVVLRRRDDHDIHTAHFVDSIEIDLWEHDLLFEPEIVVAAAVERLAVEPAEVADTRSTILKSLSRNVYIRSPRKVTLQPMDIPSRNLNAAIDFLAFVMTAF
jgi:hypothetical protein